NRAVVDGGPDKRMWKPKIFHNLKRAPGSLHDDTDRKLEAWKAALYSTAALTYFPAVDGFVDGGIYPNNPSVGALAQVYDKRYEPTPKPTPEDVLLMSVGAGHNLEYVERKDRGWGKLLSPWNWGLAQWAWDGRFVRVATDATVGVADYECRQMLDGNYFRLA